MLDITKQSNLVSERALEIEENRKLNENKEKSVRILWDLYDKIMYTPWLYDVYIKTAYNTLKWDEEYIQRFLDEFEWLWYEYCQEQIYKSDLKLYRPFFKDICNNSVIEDKYSWHRNWLSKLCLDLLWETWMWKYYKSDTECRVLKW